MVYLLIALFFFLLLGIFAASGHLGPIAASLAGIRSAIEAQNRAYGIDDDPPDENRLESDRAGKATE